MQTPAFYDTLFGDLPLSEWAQHGNRLEGEPWARFIYIGRNEMHDDRENAVDVKQSRDVIVSENTIHGYVPPPSGSDDGKRWPRACKAIIESAEPRSVQPQPPSGSCRA